MPFLDFSSLLHVAAADVGNWPLVILISSVAFVIVGISVLRLHAFLALIFAGLLAGFMAEIVKPVDQRNLIWAIDQTIFGFGDTAGKIAIVIGMATIIGMCLMKSGAADKVVRRFLAAFGENRAGIAILTATYFLSIPIFFDSMYMLMIPIAMALALRTGKDFTMYCLAICAGGVTTHSLTVPHPGPLALVEKLVDGQGRAVVDIGVSLWVGILAGIVPAGLSWFFIKKLNQWTPIPLRETATAPIEAIRKSSQRPESELPSLFASILPIIVPILLISADSVFKMVLKGGAYTWETTPGMMHLKQWIEFFGNKNFALVVGAFLSLWLLKRQSGLKMGDMGDLVGPPLETGGVIILITAAGGAFGHMLKVTGVKEFIEQWALNSNMNILVLSYLVAVLLRVAQGSATVAMQTTAAMVVGLVPNLQCDPIYLFLVIGFGAMCCSWMNDSGFWVVSKLSGFTERETLRTWTVLLTFISLVGFLFTLLMSWAWSHPFGFAK